MLRSQGPPESIDVSNLEHEPRVTRSGGPAPTSHQAVRARRDSNPNLLIRSSDTAAAMAGVGRIVLAVPAVKLHSGGTGLTVGGSVRGSRSPAVGHRVYLPMDDDAVQHGDRSWRSTAETVSDEHGQAKWQHTFPTVR